MAKKRKTNSGERRGPGRPAGVNRVTLQAGIAVETLELIERAADEEFVTPGVLAGRILDDHFTGNPDAGDFEGEPDEPASAKSGLAAARQREKSIDIEMKELKLARERRETLTVEQVKEFLDKRYATIRSRLLALPQSVVGLTPEQADEMEKAVADAMTDLSATDIGEAVNAEAQF
jgi:hypothetical protein